MATTAAKLIKIRILCPTWSGYAPVFVAQDLGYFKKLGIAVDMKFEDDRSNVMAALARGDIEVDMRTVGEHQGRPRDANTPGIIIGTIDESLGGDGVMRRRHDQVGRRHEGQDGRRRAEHPGAAAPSARTEEGGLTLNGPRHQGDRHRRYGRGLHRSSVPVVATYEPFMSQAVKNLPDRKPHL